ncbi:MAG: type II secretion system F family protein, partial [Ilumatobacteraceae bacterium]
MHYQSLDSADDAVRNDNQAPSRQLSPDAEGDRAAVAPIDQAEPKSTGAAKIKKPLFSIGKTIKPGVVMAFSRQLSSFLEAGIPVLDALEIVATQTGSPPMRIVINDIRSSIHRGTSF